MHSKASLHELSKQRHRGTPALASRVSSRIANPESKLKFCSSCSVTRHNIDHGGRRHLTSSRMAALLCCLYQFTGRSMARGRLHAAGYRHWLGRCVGTSHFREFVSSTISGRSLTDSLQQIPDTLADRYARLDHGYNSDVCSDFDRINKPTACQAGSDQAQSSATWANVVQSLLSLALNPVIGSVSDLEGRRWLLIASLWLSILPAIAFVFLLRVATLDPFWYYAASSCGGAINYLGLIFASLSDVTPEDLRAPANGLVLAGFYGGFSVAPSLAAVLSPTATAMVSLALCLLAFVLALLFLPETLPEHVRRLNKERRRQAQADQAAPSCLQTLGTALTRPVREASILGRDRTLRLITAASFFSGMVFASDATLVLYYMEDQLNVRADDFAKMFLMFGIVGIVLQGGLLQPLVNSMTEKGLLVSTFVCGTLHNFLYGVAQSKQAILLALILSQYTKLNFPLLSSIASRDASEAEQGRIQGALFASNSIAYAIGPLLMEYVYSWTKDGHSWLGPGFMFIVAAGFYAIGTILVAMLPSQDAGAEDCVAGDESSGVPTEVYLVLVSGDLAAPLLSDPLTEEASV